MLLLIALSLVASGASDPLGWRPQLEVRELEGRFIAIGADRETIERSGGRVKEELPLIGGIAFEGSLRAVKALGDRGVKVYADRVFKLVEPLRIDGKPDAASPMLYSAARALGTSALWEMGYNGSGIRIAIVDTGIENLHPWLIRNGESVVKWEYDATGEGIADYCGSNYFFPSVHGTHVAGIVASQEGRYRGVAYGADIYDIIVFSEALGCDGARESDIIRGIEAALTGPDGVPGTGDEAHIISLSLGLYATPERQAAIVAGRLESPLVMAVERAVRAGKIVVVAAGNAFAMNVANELCLASGAICVGATSHMGTPEPDDDMIAWFTSKGPGPLGKPLPHLVAPGTLIYSSVPTPLQNMYGLPEPAEYLSGTSMSTPVISGAIAVLLSARGLMSSDEALAILAATARDVKPQRAEFFWMAPPEILELIRLFMPEPEIVTVADQGAGQPDLLRAVNAEAAFLIRGKPIGYVVGNRLEIEAIAFRDVRLALKEVRLVEVYSLRDDTSYVKENIRMSLRAGERGRLEIALPQLSPGVYGGYAIFEAEGSGATYRAPFIMVSPLTLSPGVQAEIETTIASRDQLDIIVYYAENRRSLAEVMHVFLSYEPSRLSLLDVYQIYAIAPGGLVRQGSGYPLGEPGLYSIVAFILTSAGIPKSVKASVGVSVSSAGEAARLQQSVAEMSQRLVSLESRIALLASNLTSLSLALEEAKISVQRSIEALSQRLGALNATAQALSRDLGALSGNLRALEAQLNTLASSLSEKDKQLEASIAESQRRLAVAESVLATINVSLEKLSQELKKLEEESRASTRELREEHSLTRLAAIGAAILAIISLGVAAYARLRE